LIRGEKKEYDDSKGIGVLKQTSREEKTRKSKGVGKGVERRPPAFPGHHLMPNEKKKGRTGQRGIERSRGGTFLVSSFKVSKVV